MEKKKTMTKSLATEEDKGIKKLMGVEEKVLEAWLGKTKDGLNIGKWLKNARKYEKKAEYKRALDYYLRFMESKLNIIKTQPKYTMSDYLGLVRYYIKIAECYEKLTHTTKKGKIVDMEKAGEYYTKAARMYIELKRYDNAHKNYENAARCYGEVEEYDKTAKAYMEGAFMHHKLKRKLLACTSFIKAAKAYEKAGDYENASQAYLESAELNHEIRNIYGSLSSYKKTAECYDKLGKPHDAIQFYIKSAELSSKVERYSEVAEKYEGIARGYERLKDYKKAMYYHLRSATLNQGNDNLVASYGYENAAKCYAKLGKYAEGIKQYERALDLRSELKKYLEAASASRGIAEYYEKINDHENAAKFYFQYAELGLLGNQQDTAKGYKEAAGLYEEMAKKRVDENKYEKAIDDYLKATECYDRLNNKKTSADLYYKMAEMELNRDYSSAIKFYLEAANRYIEIKNIVRAAECHVLAKDYLNAARNYVDYAEMQLKRDKPFYAGTGYRKAADSYRKLKSFENMRDKYNKAVYNFTQFLEKVEYVKGDDEANKGNAYRNIGECYIELDDVPNAKKYLEQALSYYKNKKSEREIVVTEALLAKVNANLSLKLGEYEKTSGLLQDSLKLLKLAIKEGGWSNEYIEFLSSNIEKAEDLLTGIETKPEIDLVMDQPEKVFSPGSISIVGKITNNSKYKIESISFLSNAPHAFEVLEIPDVSELNPDESRDIVLEISTKSTGKFSFSPLEMLYRGKKGNKYMKAANNISIEVK
ncbi:MAG: tetratricopeptide repeat protein [Candidatus Altiarchaeota archaeon]|nr:tetratricopeptide repeat protein [Candidatus Altiarchaeota archaeon]